MWLGSGQDLRVVEVYGLGELWVMSGWMCTVDSRMKRYCGIGQGMFFRAL